MTGKKVYNKTKQKWVTMTNKFTIQGGGILGCGGGKCLYIFKSIIKTFLIMCKLLYDLFVFKTLTFNN